MATTWAASSVGIFRAYISPIIAVVGLFGNITIMLVSLKKIKMNRFDIYCTFLAAMNFMSLVFNTFLDDFLGRGLEYAAGEQYTVKIDTFTDTSCKIMEYLPTVSNFASSYILLTLSIDRIVMSTTQVLHSSTYSHLRTATGVCTLICLAGFVFNVSLASGHELKLNHTDGFGNDKAKCEVTDPKNKDLIKAGLYIKVFVTFVIPTIAVYVINVALGYIFWRMVRSDGVNATGGAEQIELRRVLTNLALSVSFFVFICPLSCVILLRLQSSVELDGKEYVDRLKHLSRLFDSFKDFSNMIIFWLLLIFVKTFRADVNCLICHCGHRPQRVNEHQLTVMLAPTHLSHM